MSKLIELFQDSTSLAKLTGKTTINENDNQFWKQLFEELTGPLSKLDIREIDYVIRTKFTNFPQNNESTHNFQKLLIKGIEKLQTIHKDFANEKKNDEKLTLNIVNLLFLMRVFSQYIIETNLAPFSDPEINDLDLTNDLDPRSMSKKQRRQWEKNQKKKNKKNPKLSKLSKESIINENIEKDENNMLSEQTEITELYNPTKLREHFSYPSMDLPKLLMETLTNYIIDQNDATEFSKYVILVEVIALMISLLSTSVFDVNIFENKNEVVTSELSDHFSDVVWIEVEEPSEENDSFDFSHFVYYMDNEKIRTLVTVLLGHISIQLQTPNPDESQWDNSRRGSFIFSPVFAIKKFFKHSNSDPTPLSTHALSLLLALLQTRTQDEFGFENDLLYSKDNLESNQFVSVISKLKNLNLDDDTEESIAHQIPFKMLLCNTLCSESVNEQSLLLAYHLLSKNKDFLKFTLESQDLSKTLLYFLEEIYQYTHGLEEYQQEKGSIIHLFLVILLILSENDDFGTFVFSQFVAVVNWYKETQLKNISIGSLCVLLLLELTQLHFPRLTSTELINSSLAIVHNLSSSFANLPVSTSEKLVEIVWFVSNKVKELSNYQGDDEETEIKQEFKSKKEEKKRRNELKKLEKKKKKQEKEKLKRLRNSSKKGIEPENLAEDFDITEIYFSDWTDIEELSTPPSVEPRPKRLVRPQKDNIFIKHNLQFPPELKFYTDVLLNLCEIINTAFTLKITQNIHLLVAILLNRKMLFSFEHHPRLWVYISNLHKLARFLNFEPPESAEILNHGIEEMKEIIKKKIPRFVFEEKGFQVLPHTKFKFFETNTKESFFFIETWNSIQKYSSLYLNPNKILILRI
ncbi:dymeclin [Anaeramoeba ignava]|uniref:Dymeclin n=1 Tax=Anaeramoeba ignava TaxID=1746090 RepID=A0A9Q0LD79_ANAIG|nr:dymeclin [Anaeramoeba ignava]